jgi:steroid delta-isomerase-like uncharacterized protein
MTRDQVLDLFTRLEHALERRDTAALASLYAETATYESPLAGTVSGREAIAGVHAAFFAAFPDVVIKTEAPLIDGDRVAAVATVSGTQIGAFMAVPPSGKPARFTVALFLVVRDSQIVHERRIYDFTGVLVQIGVLKAKPA